MASDFTLQLPKVSQYSGSMLKPLMDDGPCRRFQCSDSFTVTGLGINKTVLSLTGTTLFLNG